MSQEIVEAVRDIEREKGIESGTLVAALEDALLAAYKKMPGSSRHATVEIDDQGDFRVFSIELPPDIEERLIEEARERKLEELEALEAETGERSHTLISDDDLDVDWSDVPESQIKREDVTPANFGRDVLSLDLTFGDIGPVDVEVVVGDERVRPLAGFCLECFELFELPLACLFDQPLLDIRRELDREDAKVALVVDLNGRVTRRAGHLLVRRQKRVLECRHQRPALDALFALDVADCFNDFLAHLPTLRRSSWPGRLRRTGCRWTRFRCRS